MASIAASRRLLVLTLVAVAALAGALLLARGDQPAGAATSKALRLSADATGKLKFNKTSLTATHGKISLVMSNPGSSGTAHAIAVQGKGVDKDGKTVSPGGTSRLTLTLKKGTYTFYCPVDGHRAAGMKGRLVVK